jgi:sugar O-acyltransferase (sialic acid O-acetyltransferase NeuD family)
MKKLYIVGAGGFGRELHAWASQHPHGGKEWQLVGFLDDNANALAAFGSFAPVFPLTTHSVQADEVFLCGLGLPPAKEKLVTPLLKKGAKFIQLVHPSVMIGARVRLGQGVVICPGSVVSVDVDVGDFAMINLNSTVGHDAKIGAWTTLSAHCDVTGFVEVGPRVFMGSRVSIIPSKKIGEGATLGAGSVVIRDVAPGVTMIGNPAKVL